MTIHAVNISTCLITEVKQHRVSPDVIEVMCESLRQDEDIMKNAENQGLKWDGMSYQHFCGWLKTVPAVLFGETPYWYVLRTGKDQGQGQQLWLLQNSGI